MPLLLDDIDAEIAARVRPGYHRRPAPQRTHLRLGAIEISAVVVLGAALFYFWFNIAVIVLSVVAAFGALQAVMRLYEGKPAANAGLITASELLAAAEQAPISRADAAYCRVIACLAEGLPGLGKVQSRNLLRHLGELLRRGRELNAMERRLERVLRTESLFRLQTEREQLHDRLLQTTDAQIRYALEQALAFNAERVQNAEIFTATVERLAAQEEVIGQALASVHSTLIRSRLAFANTPVAIDALHGVVDTVARINAQTRAVEQAVAEVVALRAGGQ